MRVEHFVGLDSIQIEIHVNEFLARPNVDVVQMMYQTTLIPAELADEFQEVEYSVLILYRTGETR